MKTDEKKTTESYARSRQENEAIRDYRAKMGLPHRILDLVIQQYEEEAWNRSKEENERILQDRIIVDPPKSLLAMVIDEQCEPELYART